jgi:DNA-binding winged helix-turn-helix (wHTH) protein
VIAVQYQFDSFVLDPDNFELKKNNRPVGLRAKAFHVLAFLMKNRHRMVSKDELLDEVWHRQYIAESTLNSCIKTVRQVLGDDGKNQKIIQTVRGRGYRFVSPVEMVKPDINRHQTISRRLSERFEKTFVGREQELQVVLDALSQPVMPFWVCYLYGSGGIGKTSLLKNLCRKAADSNFVIYIDCREHEPTQEGFLQSLADTILSMAGSAKAEDRKYTLDDISSLLDDCGTRILLCLDHFESFIVLDTWMRQQFFPALPDTVLSVIASRQAPKSAWYAGSDWASAFKMLEIGELSEDDATVMLESRDLDSNQVNQVKKFANGYPLALELAAMLCRTQPDYKFTGSLAPIEVVTKLATTVLSGLPDAEKEAVEALSTVYRANEPILCALLGLRDAQKLFVKLRELPFVNYSEQGITLHDVVRDAIGKDLSYRDPVRSNQYRQNAWAFFREEAGKAPYQKLWRLTADLLFLIEVPVIREAYFPVGSSGYTIQPATRDDVDEIVKISNSAEPDEATQINCQWLQNHPEHFHVARAEDGAIAGFEYFFAPDAVDRELLLNDPITAAWLKHLENNPVEENERTLFYRRWITRDLGDAPSPVQGAFWVDIKRVYMEMRPGLRRLYLAFNDPAHMDPLVNSVSFDVLEECHVEMGGRQVYTVMCDFGENSFDGWLIRLVKKQLDGEQVGVA